MANIIDYIRWRGDIPLNQVPFGEIDALILSYLSYMPFAGILNSGMKGEGTLLGDEAQALLESRIVLTDVREGDVLLTDLWFELMARRERGSADEESIAWARENLRPPRDLDFRMS